jgi:hypothetical protein
MGAFLAWNSFANTIFFDVVGSEKHEFSSMVTEHPIETGSDVTDHVRPNLDRITLEGFVSQTPIYSDRGSQIQLPLDVQTYTPPISLNPAAAVVNAVGSLISSLSTQPIVADIFMFPNDSDFVRETMLALKGLQTTAQLVDVYTPNYAYTDMILDGWDVDRDSSTGTGANFKISLRQIKTVQSTLTNVPQPAIARAAETKAKGNQAPQAPTPGKATSLLLQGAQATGLAS